MMRNNRRRIAGATGMLLALVVLCADARAVHLLAETTTMSASRQAARIYIQTLDFATGAISPPEALPGPVRLGNAIRDEARGQYIISTTVSARPAPAGAPESWSFLSIFKAGGALSAPPVPFLGGWQQSPLAVTGDGGVLVGTGAPAGLVSGRIQFLSRDSAGKASLGRDLLLPDIPRKGVAINSRAAILCDGAYTGVPTIHYVDLTTFTLAGLPTIVADQQALAASTAGAIAATGDGRYLIAVTSGRLAKPQVLDSAAWVHVIDYQTGREVGTPLEIPGTVAAADEPLQPGTDGCWWLATRPTGTDFGYLTAFRISQKGAAQVAQYSFGGVTASFRIAVEPEGPGIAIASDNRLEVRTQSARAGAFHAYDAPIRVLRWARDGLYLGEAGRVHRVMPPKASPVETLQLSSGWVTGLMVDGAASGEVAAGPFRPMPQPRAVLDVPPVIAFSGRAAGHELKAFAIESPVDGATFNIRYSRDRMPWLVMHPLSGRTPAVVYMGIDPARYRNLTAAARGILTVSVNRPGEALQDPALTRRVHVGVTPEERSDLRRVLWLWPAGEPAGRLRTDAGHRFGALAGLLSGPPLYYAHTEAAGPFRGRLDDYTVVVLSAEAALSGVVTRPALFDYVVSGGSLLFLGAHQTQPLEASLTQWLLPAGIQLDLGVHVEGKFSQTRRHWLCRNWDSFEIRDGCAIYTDERAAALVAVPAQLQQTVLAVRSHGRGRIAALASATPLENEALTQAASESHRAFAGDLFEWLGSAGMDADYQDMDSDGLPDNVEDANRNGTVDPGETDYLAPDTDRDGIPDGLEDPNLNGRVDDGETSPLNLDTDGDAIADGADESPLPPMDAPFIASVTPASGPGEGGTPVVLNGRNFMPGSAVFFGGQPAGNVRHVSAEFLVAETPPATPPGCVDVLVQTEPGHDSYTAPQAFCYGARSHVRLLAQAQGAFAAADNIYRGTIEFSLDNPDNAPVERVVFLLKPQPAGTTTWRTPDEGAVRSGVLVREDDGRIALAVTGFARTRIGNPDDRKVFASVPFEYRGIEPLLFQVEIALVLAPNGQQLECDGESVVVTLPAP